MPPRTRMRMRVSWPMADPLSSSAATPWLSILGIGEDGREGLSQAALRVLDKAELVVGGARHLRLAEPIAARTLAWPTPFSDAYAMILQRRGRPTCVLGDRRPVSLWRRRGTGPAGAGGRDPLPPAAVGVQPRRRPARLVAARLRLPQPAWPGARTDHPLSAAAGPHAGAELGRGDARPAGRALDRARLWRLDADRAGSDRRAARTHPPNARRRFRSRRDRSAEHGGDRGHGRA